MRIGFSIDPRQGLSETDELRLVELGARLGYDSAWTPSGPDAAAFDRCVRWHGVSGLRTGISVAPASGQPGAFYAEHGARAWEATGHTFTLGVGSGQWNSHVGPRMREYVSELRGLLPEAQPVGLAALGPVMLRVAGELADAALLNWCSPEWVGWSRPRVEEAAAAVGRPAPEIVEYIRTSVGPQPARARSTLAAAALQYALGPGAYRKHFERMGFGDELARLERDGGDPSDGFLAAAGAAGAPGKVRRQFQRLAQGLDLAIVRVLVTSPGDAESARRTLEECRPA
jgi:alkanesulfonate monooxygenase SsuD/methylene tetrahydromethanopterin reductase-like flavin-dependent oxidoreductase (luciferase family)